MKTKRTIKGIVAAALALSLFAVPVVSDTGFFGVPTAIEVSAATVEVNNETALRAAINNAQSGDTIKVTGGVISLNDKITINKNINLDLTGSGLAANFGYLHTMILDVSKGVTVNINGGILNFLASGIALNVNEGAVVNLSDTAVSSPVGDMSIVSNGKVIVSGKSVIEGSVYVLSTATSKSEFSVNATTGTPSVTGDILYGVKGFSGISAPDQSLYPEINIGKNVSVKGDIKAHSNYVCAGLEAKTVLNIDPNACIRLNNGSIISSGSALKAASSNLSIAKIYDRNIRKIYYVIGNMGVIAYVGGYSLIDGSSVELINDAPALSIKSKITIQNSTGKDIIINDKKLAPEASYTIGTADKTVVTGEMAQKAFDAIWSNKVKPELEALTLDNNVKSKDLTDLISNIIGDKDTISAEMGIENLTWSYYSYTGPVLKSTNSTTGGCHVFLEFRYFDENFKYQGANYKIKLIIPKLKPDGNKDKTTLGDVNGDGKITAVDLVLTKRYVNQMITDISPAADMNGDGKVTTVDYVLLKRAYAKLV